MATKQKRWAILLLFVLAVVLVFIFGGAHYVSIVNFQLARNYLIEQRNNNPVLFGGVFFLIYATATALSVPVATVLTIVSGSLFGWPLAAALVVPAATVGSIVPFLAARYTLKEVVENKFSKAFQKLNRGIVESGWWYLLSARLITLIPFYVLNIVAGIVPISLKRYVSATFLGIIPDALIFSYAGSQLGTSSQTGQILTPGVLTALAMLAIFPLLIRYLQKRLATKEGGLRG